MKYNEKMSIDISNISQRQKIAIETFLALMVKYGNEGSNKCVSFTMDGNYSLRPEILVDNKKPEINQDLINPIYEKKVRLFIEPTENNGIKESYWDDEYFKMLFIDHDNIINI